MYRDEALAFVHMSRTDRSAARNHCRPYPCRGTRRTQTNLPSRNFQPPMRMPELQHGQKTRQLIFLECTKKVLTGTASIETAASAHMSRTDRSAARNHCRPYPCRGTRRTQTGLPFQAFKPPASTPEPKTWTKRRLSFLDVLMDLDDDGHQRNAHFFALETSVGQLLPCIVVRISAPWKIKNKMLTTIQ